MLLAEDFLYFMGYSIELPHRWSEEVNMPFKAISALVIMSVCILLMLTSCSTLEVYHTPGKKIGHGPPIHAQAHGYRCKGISGIELVYDSRQGVYIVVGLPNHYYHNGYFYRLRGTEWEVSLQINGGWVSVSEKSIPPGLQDKSKVGYKKAS